MSNDERSPNNKTSNCGLIVEAPVGLQGVPGAKPPAATRARIAAFRHSDFDILSSLVICHSSFPPVPAACLKFRRMGWRFFLQPPQQRLAKVDEPGFASAFFGRLGRARHLEDFNQVPGS